MNKFVLVLAIALGSSMAHAGLFDDQVDAQEASNALVHCAEEAKQLLTHDLAYLGGIEGKYIEVSDRVTTKTVVFQSLTGGYFSGPAAQVVAKLTVTATVTQSRVPAAPAAIVYSCLLSK